MSKLCKTIESDARAVAAHSCHPQTPAPAFDFISIDEVCRLLGGNRPVNKATIYRAISAERLPRPIMVSPNCARWLRSEIEAAIRKMIAARNIP